jgi:hypothetical protein
MNDEPIPEYLHRWPGLFEWRDGIIVDAPPKDVEVARAYPRFPDKGPLTDAARLTLMTRKSQYTVGEPVRIIHVFEAVEPGRTMYIMGPKKIFGEYVDDVLQTEPPPDDVLAPRTYNGLTLPSPAVDYNFEITSYTFHEPGVHRFQWRLAAIESNILTITVESAPEET